MGGVMNEWVCHRVLAEMIHSRDGSVGCRIMVMNSQRSMQGPGIETSCNAKVCTIQCAKQNGVHESAARL